MFQLRLADGCRLSTTPNNGQQWLHPPIIIIIIKPNNNSVSWTKRMYNNNNSQLSPCSRLTSFFAWALFSHWGYQPRLMVRSLFLFLLNYGWLMLEKHFFNVGKNVKNLLGGEKEGRRGKAAHIKTADSFFACKVNIWKVAECSSTCSTFKLSRLLSW